MNPTPLPPGQRLHHSMPRFGMTTYASRFPTELERIALSIGGEVEKPVTLTGALADLPRTTQISDFHCVTSWSVQSLTWSGYRFSDLYHHLILPVAKPKPAADFVTFTAQDGYRTSLPLEDLLADNVMIADQLNGKPLTVAHGAPVRLVAPSHYGYKSPKHLCGIDFWRNSFNFRPWYLRWMVHPRGRVALEERGRGAPGWFFRVLFRPMIASTSRTFDRQLQQYNQRKGEQDSP